mmetsp:Transcript_10927/g.32498  ORF Transcript_10927/g.32498 Transcript_10927/m.32498 type:complete len:246 (-) Transcript_10927:354-1091(-)
MPFPYDYRTQPNTTLGERGMLQRRAGRHHVWASSLSSSVWLALRHLASVLPQLTWRRMRTHTGRVPARSYRAPGWQAHMAYMAGSCLPHADHTPAHQHTAHACGQCDCVPPHTDSLATGQTIAVRPPARVAMLETALRRHTWAKGWPGGERGPGGGRPAAAWHAHRHAYRVGTISSILRIMRTVSVASVSADVVTSSGCSTLSAAMSEIAPFFTLMPAVRSPRAWRLRSSVTIWMGLRPAFSASV